MKETLKVQNPFLYSTPDQIKDPQQAIDLFVDVFKDFYLIESIGNTFIHGPRGSGKSMMFRIMQSDCQKIRLNKQIHELDYYSVYIPVKDTSLNIQDIHLLDNKHGAYILNEHLICLYFSICIFNTLKKENYSQYNEATKSFLDFYNKKFIKYLQRAGIKDFEKQNENASIDEILNSIIFTLEDLQIEFTNYLARLALGDSSLSYNGAICLYRNFLLPIIKDIRVLDFIPSKPLFFLIDDADLLSNIQSQILNTWVSFRATSDVCFKITTQLNYKNYYTSNGQTRIDSPHDYHEINLSDIFTSDNKTSHYRENVKAIVEKRIKVFLNKNISAEDFFPCDTEQDKKIKEIAERYQEEKGYDFAYRNARLDYMIGLRGNEYTFSYSGFDQLVHLSSGIIRNFIDLASKMFDRTLRDSINPEQINFISVGIQDSEIKAYSNWLLLQIDKSIESQGLQEITQSNYKKLKQLIDSIGKAFRIFLESTSTTERRKFSFYFDGEVNPELKHVLKLGVSEGLLHYSSHGSKSGLGRSHKYVFNRMLSPTYKLDPFSFSGYLYITPQNIQLAIDNPKKFITYIKNRADNNDEQNQLELDF